METSAFEINVGYAFLMFFLLNTMATIYSWSSIANSSIIYNRIFDIIKTSISIHNKKPRFFNRDFEIIKN